MLGCRGSEATPPTQSYDVAGIVIETGANQIERGYHANFTASAKDKLGKPVAVPVVWRSSDERVAVFDANGRLTALDTGVTVVTASSLGVVSGGVSVRVLWAGAAKVSQYQFNTPGAATPGATVPDSVRVLVSDRAGNPVPNVKVAFAITAGSGSITPSTAITNQKGVAAAQWVLGPVLGVNAVSATVLNDEDKPLTFVTPGPVSFSIGTFNAVAAVGGNGQSGTLLAPLPIAPSVRVVDAEGRPRPGVPVSFTPTSGGRVASSTVSTGADGIASPGVWRLGDEPGEQILIAKVESAVLNLKATATGTPIRFNPTQIVAGGYVTCAILADATVSCFGQGPKVGDGSTLNRLVPTPTQGGLHLISLSGSSALSGNDIPIPISHFCGITVERGIACWGLNALGDITGQAINSLVPTLIQSSTTWRQVSTGVAHNCALTTDLAAFCWGNNAAGQLGDRSTTPHSAPAEVYGGFKFTSIASGSLHTCALTAEGAAFCWGFNGAGQLGDGTQISRTAPTAVSGGVAFQSISAGEFWTCGLSTAGKPYCWGLTVAAPSGQTTPQGYASAPTLTSLSVGGAHACGLTTDGTAYCWGNNSGGQLGDSTLTSRTEPTAVKGALKYKSISAGYFHTCGLTTAGSAACWGLNRAGELGDSLSGLRIVPHQIVLGVTP